MRGFTVCIFLFSIFSCNSSGSEVKNELLSPEAAADQLQSNPKIVVMDVRTPAEMQSGFITGAMNLNFNSPEFQSSLDNLDHSKTYFVYCASGKRSDKAMQMMKEKGFEHILTLDGGLNAWVAAGLPTTKP